jgi:UDP-N-acetyl-D-galactosamine dehydrogenase
MKLDNVKIGIIGLGYVGLPLAIAFASKYPVVGFDISSERVRELKEGFDKTFEVESSILLELQNSINKSEKYLYVTSDFNDLSEVNIFIVTVPTPIDEFNRPELQPLKSATKTIAKYLKKNDIVIYESTVYPGLTEEEMVPILELESSLVYNNDFFCGYSPERINPGDKDHTVTQILKITSGSNEQTAEFVDKLYSSVIKAGTYKAKSIKVAEAAKVIENTQRDINIAFVNELSKIFTKLNIDTQDVLDAASTKWNFIRFNPGLVGGHCIGVDPYYLAQKSQEIGHHPEIILAGRRINDSMGKYISDLIIKKAIQKKIKFNLINAIILGITFKENCPDIRNSKVVDVYNELLEYNFPIEVYDPYANHEEVKKEFNIDMLKNLPNFDNFSIIIVAVAHKEFYNLKLKTNPNKVLFDIKGIFPKEQSDLRL